VSITLGYFPDAHHQKLHKQLQTAPEKLAQHNVNKPAVSLGTVYLTQHAHYKKFPPLRPVN